MDYIVNHIPILKGKRPGVITEMTSMTVHNTGNPTSMAITERNWLTNPSNDRTASFHIVVDSKQAIECIPLDEIAYHSGKAEGNGTSIGVEICESGNYKQNEENAIKLIADMLVQRGWGINRVRTHKSWSGKNCPRKILPYWNDFLKRVQDEIDKIKEVKSLAWKEIIKKVANNPTEWEKAINTAVNIAKADGYIGDLQILKFLPDLIEKVYNERG